MKKPTTTATILNILGLAVAIAAFLIVAMVRYYDLRYDKSYPGAERIYKLELWSKNNDGRCLRHGSLTDKTSYRIFANVTPENVTRMPSDLPFEELEDVCFMGGGCGARVYAQECPETDSVVLIRAVTPSVFRFFGIELQTGSLDHFEDSSNVVITNSLAEFLFPLGNAVGQRIVIKDMFDDDDHFIETDTLTIVAVYKDLHQNTFMADYGVIQCIKPREIENPEDVVGLTYGNIYYKLKKGCQSEAFARQLFEMLQNERQSYMASKDTTGDSKLGWDEYHEKYKDAPPKCDSISLESLDKDHHYSPMNGWIWEEHTIFISKMLGLFGIVLLLLAFLNFTNYAVATVPLYLHKTNIRKIEGCSNGRLRWEMFARFLLSASIALVIALVIVEICARTKVIPYVDLSLKLADNLPAVGIAVAVTFAVAVVASLYPVFYSTAAVNMDSALKSQLATPQRHGWWRKLLLRLQTTPSSVVQFFVSFTITLFLLLVLVQNYRMKTEDLGFETKNIYVSCLRAAKSAMTNSKADPYKMQNLMDSVSGVRSATFSLDPIMGVGTISVNWSSFKKGDTYVEIDKRDVSSNFFDFFNIGVVQGRMMELPTEQMVNEAAVKAAEEAPNKIPQAVGVLRDFHNLLSLKREILPCVYCLYNPQERGLSGRVEYFFYVKLKEGLDIQQVEDEIMQKMKSAGWGDLKLGSFKSLEQEIDKRYKDEDDFAKLMALFVAVTLFVTLTGLLGMVMLDCHYRRRELSLRRVYGASNGNILWMVVRNILIICVLCFACAAPLAVSLFRKWQQHFVLKADIPVWPFLATFLGITLLAVAITVWQALRVLRNNVE